MESRHKVEVVHSYAEPSEYDIELTIRNSAGEEETLNSQFLFMKIFYSFSNRSEQKERIAQFITAARTRYLCDLWRPLVQNRVFRRGGAVNSWSKIFLSSSP